MVAVFDTAVPVGREAISDAGGEFEFSLALPVAMKLFAFVRRAKVGRPDQAVIEEVLVQDDPALELAFLRPVGRLDIQGQADRILVRAQEAINPLVRDRLEKCALVPRVRIDTVGNKRAGPGSVVRPVAECVDLVVVRVESRLQVVRDAVLQLRAQHPGVVVPARLPVAPRDPLLDLELSLRMSLGGVDVTERRVTCGCRLAQYESSDAESCISVRQARPPFVDGSWLANPRQRAAASLVFKPANMSQAAGTSTSKYVSSAPYWPSGP